jgi:hypothetical protein
MVMERPLSPFMFSRWCRFQITSFLSIFYRGGEPTDDFVRIAVDHTNLTWKAPEEASRRMKQFDEALAPMMRDRGLVWEFHVDETPRNFWSIEGYRPPPSGSEAETRWIHENKPSAYATKAVDW